MQANGSGPMKYWHNFKVYLGGWGLPVRLRLPSLLVLHCVLLCRTGRYVIGADFPSCECRTRALRFTFYLESLFCSSFFFLASVVCGCALDPLHVPSATPPGQPPAAPALSSSGWWERIRARVPLVRWMLQRVQGRLRARKASEDTV